MDLKVKSYLERAENELILSKANFELSTNPSVKPLLKVPLDKTFFNNVISQSYYAIFYSAKAYLLSKSIITGIPNEHQKTYFEFKKLVDNGKLDRQLLDIYASESEKAEVLLNIFHWEKGKRGRFTYNVNANANIPFAEESLRNSRKFVSIIRAIIETEDNKAE